jgi:hypothetical protein
MYAIVSSRTDRVFAAKVRLWDNVLFAARHKGLQWTFEIGEHVMRRRVLRNSDASVTASQAIYHSTMRN